MARKSQAEWYEQLMGEPDADAPPEFYEDPYVKPMVKVRAVNTVLRKAKLRAQAGTALMIAGVVDGALKHIIQQALAHTRKRSKILTKELLAQVPSLVAPLHRTPSRRPQSRALQTP